MILKLGEISIVMAGHPLRGSIENTSGGDVAVVQMKDVDPEKGLNGDDLYRINLMGRKRPEYLRQGDILFVGRGYRIFAVLVDKDLEKTVAAPHLFILRIQPNATVTPDFLVWYINHRRAQRYFYSHIVGTSLPHINRTTLENLSVILPPLYVQKHIVKAHYCRLKEKALIESLIEKKKQFLDGLLEQTLEQYQEDRI